MPCGVCNRSALGVYEGIRLTLVCPACCSQGVDEEGETLLCYSRARASFPGIPPKRMKQLGFTPRRNSHYRNAAPMRLYAVAELEILAEKVDAGIAIRAEALVDQRRARLERMVRSNDISPASPIHHALFEHIFGDYLWHKKPTRKLKELKFRFGAQAISVQLCPADPVCAMNFLENRNIVVYDDDQRLRAEFEYSIFLSSRVFRLEGLLIARYICPAQLNAMKDGPLAEIPRCIDRLRKNVPRMLRMYLQGLGCGKADVDEMLKSDAVKTRVRRCVEYAHDPEAVAEKMVDFWRTRNDQVHRRHVLRQAMAKKGLHIRLDSVYCHDFINGQIDVDLDEIVGIQYITRELFEEGGPRLWRRAHHACESAFRKSLYERGNGVETSIVVALRCKNGRVY
ncbi:unnamed protein product [Pylaiella littoralis]